MGLLKLKKISRQDFDPVAEAKRVLSVTELNQLVVSAYVFGSACSDNFSEESDIDVLLVVTNDDQIKLIQNKLLQGIPSQWPFDFVVKTQVDFAERSEIGGVCFEAKNSGVKIL